MALHYFYEEYPELHLIAAGSLLIGGMPECVSAFVNTGSFVEAINIQTDLVATFRQDFSKYAGHSDKRCLNSVLTSVSRKTGEQI